MITAALVCDVLLRRRHDHSRAASMINRGHIDRPSRLNDKLRGMVHRGQIALPTARSETPVAARVADEYEVKTLVGAGPHGSVWRAVHRRSDQDVAVKVLHRPFAGDAAVRDRLT